MLADCGHSPHRDQPQALTEAVTGSPADLAVIIVVRHGSAPYAFNDEIWKKYGELFARNMSVSLSRPSLSAANTTYAVMSLVRLAGSERSSARSCARTRPLK